MLSQVQLSRYIFLLRTTFVLVRLFLFLFWVILLLLWCFVYCPFLAFVLNALVRFLTIQIIDNFLKLSKSFSLFSWWSFAECGLQISMTLFLKETLVRLFLLSLFCECNTLDCQFEFDLLSHRTMRYIACVSFTKRILVRMDHPHKGYLQVQWGIGF